MYMYLDACICIGCACICIRYGCTVHGTFCVCSCTCITVLNHFNVGIVLCAGEECFV